MKMSVKPYLSVLILMLTVLLCMPGCTSSDDDSTSTDDHGFISSFSIGAVKRLMHTTSKAGADSTYYISFSGTLFPMTIDQKNQTIENRDSLPYETRVSAALATINYTGAYLGYRAVGDTTDYTEYSSSDSINFSKPLDFMVIPNSASSKRHYTVKLNVHSQNGSKFTWSLQSETEALAALTSREMVTYHDSLIMMATTSLGEVKCAHRSAIAAGGWTIEGTSGAGTADIHTLCICNDTLMMSTTTGALLTSTDGTTWRVKGTPQEGLQILGASASRLYALQYPSIVSSEDGNVWETEYLDSKGSLLPVKDAKLTSFFLDNGTERLVLTGRSTDTGDNGGVVWSKTWNVWSEETSPRWMYYPHTEDNTWLLPQMDPLFVMPYDDGLLAMGGKTCDGKYAALDTMLYSVDYGLTWKPKDYYYMPSALKGLEGPTAIAVDDNSFIWVVVGKQTWRGRLNRLGFARKDR